MISNLPSRIPLLLALACLSPLQAIAADATHPCAPVTEPAERLACYDKAFPPPAEVYEAAEKKAVAEFGLGQNPGNLANPGQSRGDVEPERIDSLISKVEYGSGGSRTFRLENGQAWRLTEASSAGHVSEGDSVVVRKSLIGSYQLVTPSGVLLRVRRVR